MSKPMRAGSPVEPRPNLFGRGDIRCNRVVLPRLSAHPLIRLRSSGSGHANFSRIRASGSGHANFL